MSSSEPSLNGVAITNLPSVTKSTVSVSLTTLNSFSKSRGKIILKLQAYSLKRKPFRRSNLKNISGHILIRVESLTAKKTVPRNWRFLLKQYRWHVARGFRTL
ncbi:hypothetical protein VNO77_24799 [Canavalia gladiata]|uniref:Uncharacterized protein n=1 Tax=Canavalia gladiata TaxID=3824 RepID=A0AAN9QCY5_CANGL